MKEQGEDQEAAVQMSSSVIPLCKVVEDDIPLVECALMLSGGSMPVTGVLSPESDNQHVDAAGGMLKYFPFQDLLFSDSWIKVH